MGFVAWLGEFAELNNHDEEKLNINGGYAKEEKKKWVFSYMMIIIDTVCQNCNISIENQSAIFREKSMCIVKKIYFNIALKLNY